LSKGPSLGESVGAFGVEGVVTRSVRDTAAILDAIHGRMPGDPCVAPPPVRPYVEELQADPGRLRIGLLNQLPPGRTVLHPACRQAAEAAAQLLAALGHVVEESHPEALLEPDEENLVFQLRCAEIAARVRAMSQMTGKPVEPGDIEPSTWAMAEHGQRLSALDVFKALSFIEVRSRRIADWWAGGFDLLLTPTVAEPPPLLGTFAATPEKPLRGLARGLPFLVFATAFNQTGQPAISLPLHWTPEGLPVGIQLVATYGREDLLLRVASQLEQAQPWVQRRPPVSA